MRLLKAYRFRPEPKPGMAREMSRVAGCCRFVFNRALALQKERFEKKEKHLGYAALCKELTGWRDAAGSAFLAEAPIHPLQQALKDLDRAYRNFFEGRADLPRFKKKGRHDAFRFPDPKQFAVDERRGVVKFAALPTGETFAPVSSFRKYEKELAREQQKLVRKEKFSQNWRKQKARIQQMHRKIARIRNDFLHKTSTIISKTHAVIVLEDLSVKSMSRSARGTVDAPGRNVRAKAGLNKSILDRGWAEFRRQLEYKQAWHGGVVIAIDPRNTSRTCPSCGYVSAENRKTQAVFRCLRCGYTADADVNAAQNILRRGIAVNACGDTKSAVRLPAQEPTVSEVA
jgi:putative transposase